MITLTANLQDFQGAELGAVGYPAKMCIALCGFGSQLPRITGTALLAQVVKYIETTTGLFSVAIYGNDVITPTETYYTISLIDAFGNVVQAAAYRLTGSGSQDLSNLSPLITPGQVSPTIAAFIAAAPTFQGAAGTVNGVNAIFTFTASASPAPIFSVFVGGVYQTPGNDYSPPTYLGSNSWQLTLNTAPIFGPVAVVLFQQTSAGDRTITAVTTVSVSGGNLDHCIYCNFAAPATQSIPNASVAGIGYELAFIDISYLAATNPLTISCAGGINAGTTYVLNRNGGAVTLRSDGNIWRVKAVV